MIALDEADRIERTIAAIRDWVDEVIVVDSGSTDGTQALAAAAGARVLHHDWAGYGPQKRFAEAQCRNRWLLNLDADEVVPPSLRREIEALFATGEPALDGYRLRIAEIFPGETEPHPLAYYLDPVRLYRADRGRYAASPVHDRVEFPPDARLGELKPLVHHFSVRSLGEQMTKLNGYSDLQVETLASAGGRKVSLLRLVTEFPLWFLKVYFGRRHFLRGRYGFLSAMNVAFSRHLRIAKLVEWELRNKR
ncbi:MAG: glycosyltransferase family 2 protein [Hyphomicrobiaceae bacterium]|nr:glycosyltransferase family 2 protein [Hyphomicrobiaceae bacterium]